IDDFGVGQSSFAYLRQLPVCELKIDKIFIQRIADTPADRTIVRSIVDLGHHLGYHVTAEGVDNPETLEYLVGIGCDHAQGYLIAKALPAVAFEQLLASNDWIKIGRRGIAGCEGRPWRGSLPACRAWPQRRISSGMAIWMRD